MQKTEEETLEIKLLKLGMEREGININYVDERRKQQYVMQ